jgi:hypothetical protein
MLHVCHAQPGARWLQLPLKGKIADGFRPSIDHFEPRTEPVLLSCSSADGNVQVDK